MLNRAAVQWRQAAARLWLRRGRAWPWALGALAAAAGAWLVLAAAGAGGWPLAGRALAGVLWLAAAMESWRAWRAPGAGGPARVRLAWALLAAALGLWALGHWLALALAWPSAGAAARPTAADLVRLAGHAGVGVALAAYPVGQREHLGRLRVTLDILVTAVAVGTLGWLALVQPLAASAPDAMRAGWAAAYPVMDLGLLIVLAVVVIALPPGEHTPPLLLAGAGLAANLLADTAEAWEYALALPGSGAANLGWAAAALLLGAAAGWQRLNWTRAAPLGAGERGRRLQTALKAALPVLATFAVSWYVLLNIRDTGQPDLGGLTVAVLLALMLVTRQGVIAGELELRQYAQLVNSAADPAFVCDAEGRLRLVNPALTAATGYAAEALRRQPAAMLFADGRLPLNPGERPERIFETGWTGEVMWRRSDGSVFPAHLALRPVPSDLPARAGLVGTAHDLSAQKRHEATLLAAYDEVAAARLALEALNAQLEGMVDEKTRSLSEAYERLAHQHETLQTLDELKSEFVSLVSHELRAPLTNIGGGIELLLSSGGALTPNAQRALHLVQAEIQRLTQFVETILDLSALEAGRLPLYPEPQDLRAMIRAVVGRFEGRPGAERLRVVAPDDLPTALADEQALASVLFHLVDNALKYAPQGEVVVAARAAQGRLEVSVADQGPGIPPELMDKVFDKFERLDAEDNRDVYGHGLGLYMARRLLEAQGGGIAAASRASGGARLTFWIPISEADHAEQAAYSG